MHLLQLLQILVWPRLQRNPTQPDLMPALHPGRNQTYIDKLECFDP